MTDFAREYGEGLYDLAKEEGLSEGILTQIDQLQEIFREQPDFLKLLSNRALGLQERFGILESTLKAQVHPYVLNFLKILCQRDSLHEFRGCVQVFADSYRRDHQVAMATVTTAAPLSQDQKARIMARLQEMTGRQVELVEKLDPTVLGGVILEMEGRRWDNTIQSRLKNIRQVIAGA